MRDERDEMKREIRDKIVSTVPTELLPLKICESRMNNSEILVSVMSHIIQSEKKRLPTQTYTPCG